MSDPLVEAVIEASRDVANNMPYVMADPVEGPLMARLIEAVEALTDREAQGEKGNSCRLTSLGDFVFVINGKACGCTPEKLLELIEKDLRKPPAHSECSKTDKDIHKSIQNGTAHSEKVDRPDMLVPLGADRGVLAGWGCAWQAYALSLSLSLEANGPRVEALERRERIRELEAQACLCSTVFSTAKVESKECYRCRDLNALRQQGKGEV